MESKFTVMVDDGQPVATAERKRQCETNHTDEEAEEREWASMRTCRESRASEGRMTRQNGRRGRGPRATETKNDVSYSLFSIAGKGRLRARVSEECTKGGQGGTK